MNLKSIISTIHPRQPLQNLQWFDVMILTIILWGESIFLSTQIWLNSLASGETLHVSVDSFSSSDNWWAIGNELKFLTIAVIYLLIRRFDFSQLPIQFNWKAFFWVPVIFLGAGLLCDLVFDLYVTVSKSTESVTFLSYLPYYDWSLSTVVGQFSSLDTSLLLFSLVNGFYEELFFLGFLLSSDSRYRPWIVAFSTLVRISFHTYQGLTSALIIGIVFGLFYYYLYTKKMNNLLPFFLAHALADIVGTSFFTLFIPQ